MMRKNFMHSGICLYSWCTVPRMKFVFCLSARGVQFGFLLKLCAWKGKVSGMSTKFVFVTGGVVSGLGKGICAASLGRLLKQRGVRVRNQKFDPYINVDPGTMSPYQHGEVFVTEDGAETDLDLGHYERFVDEDLTGNSSVSSGKVYWSVLNRERRGDYLAALCTDGAGKWCMCVYERDSVFTDRWRGGGGKPSLTAGELGSWNFGNPQEAVIIFCGGDLPEEAVWYTFQNSGITYTCPIENGRVLDVFVLPDTGDISSYPEEVLDQDGNPLDVRYEGDLRPET